MNSTPEIIYKTARSLTKGIRYFHDKINILSYNKEENPLKPTIDLLGRYKELLVALGARGIEYNDEDLKRALVIARNNLDVAKANFDEAAADISSNLFKEFLSDYPYFVLVTYCGILAIIRVVVEAFSLSWIFFFVTGIPLLLIAYPLMRINVKYENFRKIYHTELETEYLISSLQSYNINRRDL
jgi:hypothetical protein